jgi:hypothetical protein
MRPLAAITLIAMMAAGCREDPRLRAKLDPGLQQQLEDLAGAGTRAELSVLGKCSSPIDEPMQSRLRRAGAAIETTAGDIFSAHVRSDSVLQVARLSFVVSLALAGSANPHGSP